MVKAIFSPITLAVMGLFIMTAVVANASEQESKTMEKAGKEVTMPTPSKPSDAQSESENKKGTVKNVQEGEK